MKTYFIKTSLVAVALASALAAPAIAKEVDQKFERDGVTYSYSASSVETGTRIAGGNSQGDRYDLLVREGRVSGTYNGRSIRFNLSGQPASKQAEITMR